MHGIALITITLTDQCENGEIRRLAVHNGLGRVEICIGGVWGTICSDAQWDNKDAGVACRQLGYSQYGNTCCFDLFAGIFMLRVYINSFN